MAWRPRGLWLVRFFSKAVLEPFSEKVPVAGTIVKPAGTTVQFMKAERSADWARRQRVLFQGLATQIGNGSAVALEEATHAYLSSTTATLDATLARSAIALTASALATRADRTSLLTQAADAMGRNETYERCTLEAGLAWLQHIALDPSVSGLRDREWFQRAGQPAADKPGMALPLSYVGAELLLQHRTEIPPAARLRLPCAGPHESCMADSDLHQASTELGVLLHKVRSEDAKMRVAFATYNNDADYDGHVTPVMLLRHDEQVLGLVYDSLGYEPRRDERGRISRLIRVLADVSATPAGESVAWFYVGKKRQNDATSCVTLAVQETLGLATEGAEAQRGWLNKALERPAREVRTQGGTLEMREVRDLPWCLRRGEQSSTVEVPAGESPLPLRGQTEDYPGTNATLSIQALTDFAWLLDRDRATCAVPGTGATP